MTKQIPSANLKGGLEAVLWMSENGLKTSMTPLRHPLREEEALVRFFFCYSSNTCGWGKASQTKILSFIGQFILIK